MFSSKSSGMLDTQSDYQTVMALVLCIAEGLDMGDMTEDHSGLFWKTRFRMMGILAPMFVMAWKQLVLMVSYLNIRRNCDRIAHNADSSV